MQTETIKATTKAGICAGGGRVNQHPHSVSSKIFNRDVDPDNGRSINSAGKIIQTTQC